MIFSSCWYCLEPCLQKLCVSFDTSDHWYSLQLLNGWLQFSHHKELNPINSSTRYVKLFENCLKHYNARISFFYFNAQVFVFSVIQMYYFTGMISWKSSPIWHWHREIVILILLTDKSVTYQFTHHNSFSTFHLQANVM